MNVVTYFNNTYLLQIGIFWTNAIVIYLPKVLTIRFCDLIKLTVITFLGSNFIMLQYLT